MSTSGLLDSIGSDNRTKFGGLLKFTSTCLFFNYLRLPVLALVFSVFGPLCYFAGEFPSFGNELLIGLFPLCL